MPGTVTSLGDQMGMVPVIRELTFECRCLFMFFRVAAPYQWYAGHLGKIMVFCLLPGKKNDEVFISP